MSRERWLCIWDGKVMYHSENDGPVYLRKGPEGVDYDVRFGDDGRVFYVTRGGDQVTLDRDFATRARKLQATLK